MRTTSPRPLLLCDIDDVLCLGRPYGAAHARNALIRPSSAPLDLWRKLFTESAVQALNVLLDEFNPTIVITSTWLALLDHEHFIELFQRTRLERFARNLHQHWDAPANYGESRLEAIDKWLDAHHVDEPVLILDDTNSGESLIGSFHHEAGRAILCEPEKGFHSGMLDSARRALRRPYSRNQPWLL